MDDKPQVTHFVGDDCEGGHIELEKTSAWPKERLLVDLVDEKKGEGVAPEPPPWIMSFLPESRISHGGWDCVIRHVGCEEGRWLVLLEPMCKAEGRKGPSRGATRAEYRRLKAKVGKKKARDVLAKRRETAHASNADGG